MSERFIHVLKSLSAPPCADFLFTAVHSGHFKPHELLDMFGEEFVDDTLTLALEYIDSGSILVLPSKRQPYQSLLAQFAAVRVHQTNPGVEWHGKHP